MEGRFFGGIEFLWFEGSIFIPFHLRKSSAIKFSVTAFL